MEERIQRLEKLARLLEKGALTPDEFAVEKAKIISIYSRDVPLNERAAIGRESTRTAETLTTDRATNLDRQTAAFASKPQMATADSSCPEDDQAIASDWRRWIRWVALAFLTLGLVVILAKFGTVIAILLGLAGLCVHFYAGAKSDPDIKPIAFAAYIAAVVVYFAGSFASSILPRPTESQLSENEYSSECRSEADFKDKCLGRFVIWDGVLERDGISLDDDAFRINLGDKTIDLYGSDLDDGAYFEGIKVRFSGYLSKDNTVFDDVTDGKILEIINTPEQAVVERKAREVEARQRRAASIVNRAYESGEVQGMLGTLEDCKPFLANQVVYGECLNRSAAARGWD